MRSEGSVTVWLNSLPEKNPQATQALWDRFFQRVVRFARSRLDGDGNPKGEEEDLALSVFQEFFQAAGDNQFSQLANRNDLWQILHLLVSRKAVDYYRRTNRQKRVQYTQLDYDPAVSNTDPALIANVMDEVRVLFDQLPSTTLREVATLKLDGYTNEEIAEKLHCTQRTVERRLGLIRSLWSQSKTA